MGHPYPASAEEIGRARSFTDTGAERSLSLDHAGVVSWGAIFAGAAAAAALSLIMLMLGVGLGLSSVSPWAYDGVSAATLGVSTIAWVTFTQLVASAMGGYLAGRLRTRWVAVHGDEVHFRDTAHGFLAWAVASLVTAALLTSAIGSIVSGGAQAGASVAGATATTAAVGAATAGSQMAAKPDSDAGPVGYFVDSLFRKDSGAAAANAGAGATGTVAGSQTAAAADTGNSAPASPAAPNATTEVGRIFLTNLQASTLPADDARYVAQLVAQRTGLSQPEAEKRVSDTYGRLQASLQKAKASALEAADKARKASATLTLWLFIALLTGAFVASLSATYGGRQRDL